MPYGEIDLKIPKDKDRPTLDQIFKSFRTAKSLKIKAEVKKPARWRPVGKNFYEIKIISIERMEDGDYYHGYKARAILLGMNNKKGVFPEDFSWSHEGPKHEVRLFFSTYNNMLFQYGEYITL